MNPIFQEKRPADSTWEQSANKLPKLTVDEQTADKSLCDLFTKSVSMCENSDFVDGVVPQTIVTSLPTSEDKAILTAVQRDGLLLGDIGEAWCDHREIVLAAVQQNGNALQYASEALRNDREIALAAVQQTGSALMYVGTSSQADREIVMAAVEDYGLALKYADEALQDDSAIVLAAVRCCGLALEYASERLQNNLEIALAAVEDDSQALTYVGSTLKSDPSFVSAPKGEKNHPWDITLLTEELIKTLSSVIDPQLYQSQQPLDLSKHDKPYLLNAIQQGTLTLQNVPGQLRYDRDITLAAVKHDGLALEYAGDGWRNDREIVLAAVRQNGLALNYASAQLQGIKKIVLAAVWQCGVALKYASAEQRCDREIALAAVRQNGRALESIGGSLCEELTLIAAAYQDRRFDLSLLDEKPRQLILKGIKRLLSVSPQTFATLKSGKQLMLALVRDDGSVLKDLPEKFRGDRDIFLAALESPQGAELRFAPAPLRGDRTVVLAAVSKRGSEIEEADPALQCDAAILSAAFKGGFTITQATTAFLRNRQNSLAILRSESYKLPGIHEIFQNDRGALSDDREVVLAAVQRDGSALRFASERLRRDGEVVLTAVKRDGMALRVAAADLRNNLDIVLAAVQSNGMILEFVHKDLRSHVPVVLAAVQQNVMALPFASEELRDNWDIVSAAVEKEGSILQFASARLRNNKDMALKAVQKSYLVFDCLNSGLQQDRDIILAALAALKENSNWIPKPGGGGPLHLSMDREIILEFVNRKADILPLIKEEFRDDQEIVLKAVQRKGEMLQFASPRLRSNRDVVLTAVQNNGLALEFASAELRGNPEVALAALKQNIAALPFVSKELHCDREAVLALLQRSGTALQYVNEELRRDRKVAFTSIEQDGRALRHAPDEIRCDPEAVLSAVQQDGKIMRFANAELRRDRNFVLKAVEKNGMALQFVSLELRNDQDVVLAAVKQNGRALQFAHKNLQNDRKLVLAAIEQNGTALQFASQALRSDRAVVLAAIQQNEMAVQFASKELRNDREFILALVRKNGKMLRLASPELCNDRKVALMAVWQNGNALEFVSEELRHDEKVVRTAVRQTREALQFASATLRNDPKILLFVDLLYDCTAERLRMMAELLPKSSSLRQELTNTPTYSLQTIKWNKRMQAEEVDPIAPKIDLDYLQALFTLITTTDQKSLYYFDPRAKKLQNPKRELDYAQRGLKRLIENIKYYSKSLGVPDDKEARYGWYSQLENKLRLIFVKMREKIVLRDKLAMDTVIGELIALGKAGHNCGEEWWLTAQQAYAVLSGQWIIANPTGLEWQLSVWKDQYLEGILNEFVLHFSRADDAGNQTYFYNYAAKLITDRGIRLPSSLSIDLEAMFLPRKMAYIKTREFIDRHIGPSFAKEIQNEIAVLNENISRLSQTTIAARQSGTTAKLDQSVISRERNLHLERRNDIISKLLAQMRSFAEDFSSQHKINLENQLVNYGTKHVFGKLADPTIPVKLEDLFIPMNLDETAMQKFIDDRLDPFAFAKAIHCHLLANQRRDLSAGQEILVQMRAYAEEKLLPHSPAYAEIVALEDQREQLQYTYGKRTLEERRQQKEARRELLASWLVGGMIDQEEEGELQVISREIATLEAQLNDPSAVCAAGAEEARNCLSAKRDQCLDSLLRHNYLLLKNPLTGMYTEPTVLGTLLWLEHCGYLTNKGR